MPLDQDLPFLVEVIDTRYVFASLSSRCLVVFLFLCVLDFSFFWNDAFCDVCLVGSGSSYTHPTVQTKLN